jgi:hypothetical protein
MTRGRDENRLLVVTETTDLGDARDVIESVLAHDRADVPAVTQRRELNRQMRPVTPPRRTPEPLLAIPGWFGTWRAQVEQRRDDLIDQSTEQANQSSRAEADLAALQPALVEARAAWHPYKQPINQLEDELASTLRPAMWKANHEALRAGFGHRHAAARRATLANRLVADAEARIAAIRVEGEPVKNRLDALDNEARNLHDMARPLAGLTRLDDYDRRQLETVDRLLDSADTYLAWAHGQPVATNELADAVADLTAQAQHAHHYPLDRNQISRSQWNGLLELSGELLRDKGIELGIDRHHEHERRGPDLGLGL